MRLIRLGFECEHECGIAMRCQVLILIEFSYKNRPDMSFDDVTVEVNRESRKQFYTLISLIYRPTKSLKLCKTTLALWSIR